MVSRLVIAAFLTAALLSGCAKQSAGPRMSVISTPADSAQSAPPPADDPMLPQDPLATAPPTPMAFLPAAGEAADQAPVVLASTGAGPWSAAVEASIVEAAPEAGTPYLLDAGDKVRVFVYGQPNLSRVYPIDGGGFISMPLIGEVKARGLTTYSLGEAIAAELRVAYVRDPEVAVEVAAYRPFFVLGEVRNAGQYAYAPGMTVRSAVALAGGYGPRASQRYVEISRVKDGASLTIEAAPEEQVEPGDTISVPERFF
jgi:polysaccharide export outer membrane protein